ncbi:MAG: hypothetical protein PUP93_18635 [Rhizonema sp. NSF051]|nr:hypothetical protein [Rhizonema sp. NSF051]
MNTVALNGQPYTKSSLKTTIKGAFLGKARRTEDSVRRALRHSIGTQQIKPLKM